LQLRQKTSVEKQTYKKSAADAADFKKISDQNEFKSDLIRITNLDKKLREHKFDINRFWSQQPSAPYQEIINDADSIKKSVK